MCGSFLLENFGVLITISYRCIFPIEYNEIMHLIEK